MIKTSHQIPAKLWPQIRTISCTSSIDLNNLHPKVRSFVEEKANLCQPDNIHICDGSDEENELILNLMKDNGMIVKLKKYENW